MLPPAPRVSSGDSAKISRTPARIIPHHAPLIVKSSPDLNPDLHRCAGIVDISSMTQSPARAVRSPWRLLVEARVACLLALAACNTPTALSAAEVAPVASKAGKAFRKVADEMDKAMQADNAAVESAPLSYPKGNGLRVLMTGHSWVAPGKITLPIIAKAAGYNDHVQRDHTSGGASGSANSIWLNEHGQDKQKPRRVILLPAIPTGQWDVMTWGMYTNDKLQDYTQWMEPCLKANPAMVFYIQDGWPTPRFGSGGRAGDTTFPALRQIYVDTMMPMFRDNFDALDRAYPGKVHIIPAGAAVVEMLGHYEAGELPGFDCVTEINGGTRGIYSPDSFHLSRTSGIGWLVGYCYYGVLYKKSPELIANFHPKGVDAKVDRIMRLSAWHAIVHSPFSGLTDENGNGIADQVER
jgi:hypothetical protein